jgi:hypothetical protein
VQTGIEQHNQYLSKKRELILLFSSSANQLPGIDRTNNALRAARNLKV